MHAENFGVYGSVRTTFTDQEITHIRTLTRIADIGGGAVADAIPEGQPGAGGYDWEMMTDLGSCSRPTCLRPLDTITQSQSWHLSFRTASRSND